jgi:hypothetical protein
MDHSNAHIYHHSVQKKSIHFGSYFQLLNYSNYSIPQPASVPESEPSRPRLFRRPGLRLSFLNRVRTAAFASAKTTTTKANEVSEDSVVPFGGRVSLFSGARQRFRPTTEANKEDSEDSGSSLFTSARQRLPTTEANKEDSEDSEDSGNSLFTSPRQRFRPRSGPRKVTLTIKTINLFCPVARGSLFWSTKAIGPGAKQRLYIHPDKTHLDVVHFSKNLFSKN